MCSVTTYILFYGRMYVMLNVAYVSWWVKDQLKNCHALVCTLLVWICCVMLRRLCFGWHKLWFIAMDLSCLSCLKWMNNKLNLTQLNIDRQLVTNLRVGCWRRYLGLSVRNGQETRDRQADSYIMRSFCYFIPQQILFRWYNQEK